MGDVLTYRQTKMKYKTLFDIDDIYNAFFRRKLIRQSYKSIDYPEYR